MNFFRLNTTSLIHSNLQLLKHVQLQVANSKDRNFQLKVNNMLNEVSKSGPKLLKNLSKKRKQDPVKLYPNKRSC